MEPPGGKGAGTLVELELLKTEVNIAGKATFQYKSIGAWRKTQQVRWRGFWGHALKKAWGSVLIGVSLWCGGRACTRVGRAAAAPLQVLPGLGARRGGRQSPGWAYCGPPWPISSPVAFSRNRFPAPPPHDRSNQKPSLSFKFIHFWKTFWKIIFHRCCYLLLTAFDPFAPRICKCKSPMSLLTPAPLSLAPAPCRAGAQQESIVLN